MDILKELIEKGIIEEIPFKTQTEELPEYKVIHHPKPCEDCGKQVIDRRKKIVFYRTIFNIKDCPHWEESCLSCKLFKNPKTLKFEVTRNELQSILKQSQRDKHK